MSGCVKAARGSNWSPNALLPGSQDEQAERQVAIPLVAIPSSPNSDACLHFLRMLRSMVGSNSADLHWIRTSSIQSF
jgi:hypothetical protein